MFITLFLLVLCKSKLIIPYTKTKYTFKKIKYKKKPSMIFFIIESLLLVNLLYRNIYKISFFLITNILEFVAFSFEIFLQNIEEL